MRITPVLSTVFDVPSGSLIVWCLVVLATIMVCMRKLMDGKTREAHA